MKEIAVKALFCEVDTEGGGAGGGGNEQDRIET